MSLKKFYQGKKVFVTGHTGFKGAWLCLILKKFGAEVTGYSLEPYDRRGNLFNLATVEEGLHSIYGDIRDAEKLTTKFMAAEPNIVFHLAAQPFVRASYADPVYNYDTNLMGTVNIMEAVRKTDSVRTIINITTDKCYENKEWCWPYRENDHLGGHDPYSASKACSEIITASYRKSFLSQSVGVATARAGNVIGGGDFGEDRIIPDIVESLQENQPVILRSPEAIRPWQHVFDVLNGYMILGKKCYSEPEKYSVAYNFSPPSAIETNVETIAKSFIDALGQGSYEIDQDTQNVHEARILKLDPSKAIFELRWYPRYDTKNSIKKTADWYKHFLTKKPMQQVCFDQISEYFGSEN